MSYFEEQIRNSRFFKALEAAGATPVFQGSEYWCKHDKFWFRLPTVEEASQAVNNIRSAFKDGMKYHHGNIYNSFNAKYVPSINGVPTKRVEDGDVNTVLTNVIEIRISQPNGTHLVDKYVKALDALADAPPAWLVSKQKPTVAEPEAVVQGEFASVGGDVSRFTNRLTVEQAAENSLADKIAERLKEPRKGAQRLNFQR